MLQCVTVNGAPMRQKLRNQGTEAASYRVAPSKRSAE